MVEDILVDLRINWLHKRWNKVELAILPQEVFNKGVKNGDNIGQSIWSTGALPVNNYA